MLPNVCMTGEAIYKNFAEGRGGERLTAAAVEINTLASDYERRASDIGRLTAHMESIWQGDASGAAARGAAPIAAQHEAAHPHLKTMQDLLHRQVGSFDQAKGTVQVVPTVPEEPGIWDNIRTLGGASETYEQQVTQNREANAHNVRTMNTYAGESGYNTTNMPTEYGAPEAKPADAPPAEDPRTTSDPRTTGRTDGRTPVAPPSGWDGPGSTTASGWSAPTTSGGFTPPPGGPGVPTPPGQGPGGHVPPGGIGGPGMLPPGGVPPGAMPPGRVSPGYRDGPGGPGNGPGGLGNGRGGPGGMRAGGVGGVGGGRGGFGPGGNGSGGGFGAGGGPRAGGGGFGPGGSGQGLGAGGAAGAEEQGRGRAGAGMAGAGAGAADAGRGRGGAPMGGGGGGGGGRGGEDLEHQRASFLVEDDADELFGTDEVTAPPVIGG